MEKKVVNQINENDNREEIYCSTYEMRNFYEQFRDGVGSPLDFFNYVQHYKISLMPRKDDVVLDACCGRGLYLPLLRRFNKDIKAYIGVDICEKNLNEAKTKTGAGRLINTIRNNKGEGNFKDASDYYPFKTIFILSDITEISNHIENEQIDFVIYTSSIEHMTKEAGDKSISELYKIMKKGATMIISTPNTTAESGYDVQYKRAHLYERNYNEYIKLFEENKFTIKGNYGIFMNKTDISKMIQEKYPEALNFYNKCSEWLPRDLIAAVFGVPFPLESKEVLFVLEK